MVFKPENDLGQRTNSLTRSHAYLYQYSCLSNNIRGVRSNCPWPVGWNSKVVRASPAVTAWLPQYRMWQCWRTPFKSLVLLVCAIAVACLAAAFQLAGRDIFDDRAVNSPVWCAGRAQPCNPQPVSLASSWLSEGIATFSSRTHATQSKECLPLVSAKITENDLEPWLHAA